MSSSSSLPSSYLSPSPSLSLTIALSPGAFFLPLPLRTAKRLAVGTVVTGPPTKRTQQ